jgi:two-component system sensor histidine kinase/response regulator
VDRIIQRDLKTPLTVIMWVPDMLKSDSNLTESQVQKLDLLNQASLSMIKIMNSSINLIKMERGEYQVQASPVNILTPLYQIKNEMKELLRTKNLNMEILVNGLKPDESDNFTIQGEEILFYTILINLLKNAIEASPDDNKVTVSLKDEKNISLEIHNQGVVPKDISNSFFDKYVTAGKSSGTGLGTYSARLITEAMNGSINMQTSPENGTLITPLFPKK